MFSEDLHCEESEYQSSEDALSNESLTYKEDTGKKEDSNKKRHLGGRCGNNPGRVKRVVSCKRKTRHSTLSSGGRRRPSVTGRTFDTVSTESERKEEEDMIFGDSWQFPLTQSHTQNCQMETSDIRYHDYFSKISKDHSIMTQVLFGRNLKLSIALTLWQRNVGELLTYLARLQDTSITVHCLPFITESLQNKSRRVSVGFCVDLFPLVKSVLQSQYEDYIITGLNWIQSVLRLWWPQLTGNGESVSDITSSDKRNIHVIKQQLQELWEEESRLCSSSGRIGEMWKVKEGPKTL
ncbi:KATNB1-like protein 1 [Chanos chanos]|uniref:KATNB1-like protein 1 n=1 Tax=Chanos chanos TaxID=29144 RepID=A0A6J2WFM5_CHACN|nr:KATNB1-like protein 1 [Chanos chanos]